MGLFSKKHSWNSYFDAAAEKGFLAITDQAEYVLVIKECTFHPCLRLRAAAAIQDEALLADYMEQQKQAYQKERERLEKNLANYADSVRMGYLQENDLFYTGRPCEVVWKCGAHPELLRAWAADPLLPPLVQAEAAAMLDPATNAMTFVQPLTVSLLLSTALNSLYNARCLFPLLLVRFYRAYPEGFARPAEDWTLEKLGEEAAKQPQGDAHKAFLAQLIRRIGWSAYAGWKDTAGSFATETYEIFSEAMPQGDNLRSMWEGFLKK